MAGGLWNGSFGCWAAERCFSSVMFITIGLRLICLTSLICTNKMNDTFFHRKSMEADDVKLIINDLELIVLKVTTLSKLRPETPLF